MKRTFVASALFLAFALGCTDLSESPQSSISPTNFYRNEAEVLAGLAGVYAQLRSTLDLIDGPWVVTGATKNYSFAVPNNPAVVNFHLFTQAIVWLVPPQNPFGAITSGGVDIPRQVELEDDLACPQIARRCHFVDAGNPCELSLQRSSHR